MSSEGNRRYFMVRTEASDVRKDRVAVGWRQADFSQFNSGQDLLRHIRAHYGPIRSARQAERFFEMREGDVVVSPLSGSIAIGVVSSSECQFDSASSQAYPNVRRVHFRRQEGQPVRIPRSLLSTALQSRLRAPGLIVSELKSFASELEELLNKDPDFSFRNRAEQRNSELAETFKSELLERIQSGQTHLKGGGLGLEKLVRQLLETQGYQARSLGTRGFDGKADADIEAVKDDSFSTTRLLVQVKHHQGETGSWGIEQLDKIRADSRYDDCDMVLVSSGSFSETTAAHAYERNISLIGGCRLVEIILENASALPADTLHELGISSVPQLLPRT
ncbi:MAG TPA: restriction endonuclease [Pseudomonas sp.]